VVKSEFDSHFQKSFSKIKDNNLKNKIIKQFEKILQNPSIGKPMKYLRSGTREVYVSPYRLSYLYIEKEDRVVFLELYHKDSQ